MPWPIRFGPEPRISTFGRSVCGATPTRPPGRSRRRVVVRRARRELGGAGVDGLVDRPDAEPVAQRPHPVLAGELRPQRGDLPVGQAGPLGPAQQRLVEHGGRRRSRRAARRAPRSGRGTTGRCRCAPRRLADARARRAAPARRRRSGRRCGMRSASSGASAGSGRGPEPGRPSSPSSASPCPAPRRSCGRAPSPRRRDFIVVVSSGSAPGNFSNANRGIFTTT